MLFSLGFEVLFHGRLGSRFDTTKAHRNLRTHGTRHDNVSVKGRWVFRVVFETAIRDFSYLAWERANQTCLAPERPKTTLLLVVLDDFVPAVEKPDEFDNPFEQLTRRPPRRTASTKRVVREREKANRGCLSCRGASDT
jgi:hypothetical protein